MRGGNRQGAGRPKTDKKTVCVRLDNLALHLLFFADNKSKTINQAIKLWYQVNKPIIYKLTLQELKDN